MWRKAPSKKQYRREEPHRRGGGIGEGRKAHPSSPTLTPSLSSLNPNIAHKFTQENYPFWKMQVFQLLQTHELFGHVDGSIVVPPMLIADAIGIIIPNIDYSFGYHKDKLILSALISSLTTGFQSHVLRLKSSNVVWLTLERLFSSQSQS